LAEYLGGEQALRKFEAALAGSLELGGVTRLEFESVPGSGQVLKHLLLHGGAGW
jgi:hypothetical protein